LPAVHVWAEVFDRAAGKWCARSSGSPMSAGPTRSTFQAVGGEPWQVGQALSDAQSYIWVLAASEGGGVRDVTRRYCARWSVVLNARGSLGRAWDELVGCFAGGSIVEAEEDTAMVASAELARADLIDEETLARRVRREPLPTSRAGFKRHSGYVLESQLKQNEVVHPPGAKPVGLFRGQEPVWRRADIAELRTPAQWRREGRRVRDDERALKTLRGGSAFMATLFGIWQTEVQSVPEMLEPDLKDQGGPIPGVNNYGNIELMGPDAPTRVPPGTVYLPEEAARSAAQRLGVSCAPAVVAFSREHGQLRPRFGGVIVWACDEAKVRQAAAAEQERMEALQQQRRQERLGAAWRMLVKNVLVDLYVEGRYGGAVAG